MFTDDHFGVHDLDLVLGVVVSLAAETGCRAALEPCVALLGTLRNAQSLDLSERTWYCIGGTGVVEVRVVREVVATHVALPIQWIGHLP